MTSVQCDYWIPTSKTDERLCENDAKWLVAYITPDDSGMRRHEEARRCYWHTDERFFPKGTTGITTSALASRASRAGERTHD